jgi:3',5'-cyclic AMP phosphodiesterase CpdA
MLLAQVSDTHVLDPASDEERWVDNNGRLAEAVRALNDERPRPEVVLATGDLTNNAEPGELAELVRLLAPLEIPLLVLPGNHDARDGLRATFDMPWASEDHLSWTVQLGPLRLIGLDTLVPGKAHGELDSEREEWLRQALAEAGSRPTAVAMHHPPFASGISWMDRSRLRRADAFVALLRANPQVSRVFCGHLHRPVQAVVGGVTTTACLSTVHHVALNLAADAPIEIIRDPAGYQLHHYDDDSATWVSHTRYIDTGEKPFAP